MPLIVILGPIHVVVVQLRQMFPAREFFVVTRSPARGKPPDLTEPDTRLAESGNRDYVLY